MAGAGGFKNFGPTFNTTPYVRLGYEGILNGVHEIDVAAAQAVSGELAGRFASIGENGVGVAGLGGANAVGLFREDLGDMQNASAKATFYFRGGEYYVAAGRTGLFASAVEFVDTKRVVGTFKDIAPDTGGATPLDDGLQIGYNDPADPTGANTGLAAADKVLKLGDQITCDNQGRIIPLSAAPAGSKALGVVTHLGPYSAGNMYANAGTLANAGDFVGFILYI